MSRRWRSAIALGLLATCAIPVFSSNASETITYRYDGRGRLVQVIRSGSVNDGVQASYGYDKGDNRVDVTVTGPGFSVNDVSAPEGSPLTFTVTRSGATGSSATVNYATSDGTAAAGTDYYAASGTLTFGIGVTTQTVTVSTIDDGSVEANDTLTLTLSGATGGVSIADANGAGTIVNNDENPPSFIINDVSVSEGQSATVTVTKSGTVSSSYSVNFATSDGSAVAGTNYTTTSGTLTFAAGEASKTISVPTLNDGQVQSNKSFTVNLSAPTGGATLSDNSGTVTVQEVGDLILYAGQSFWSGDGRFQLIMQTDGNLVLYGPDGYMWASGTNGGSDRRMVFHADGNLVVYNSANQALWNSGTQGNPGAWLSLQNDGNLVIYSSSNVGLWSTQTVYQPPYFSINDVSGTEGGNLVFTVTRNKSTTATYTVNFSTADGSASAGSDFYGGSGYITFAPAETSKAITIGTIDDTAIESAENLYVNLTGASGGGAIGDGQGIGTINDNDIPPCSGVGFSVNDIAVLEGDALTFTISKSGAATGNCSVGYASANGSAITPNDYAAISGTLTFTPGESAKTVSTTTVIAGPNEPTEFMVLNLSNPTGGAALSDGQGRGTIYNNFDGCLTCLQSQAEPPPEGE